MLTTSNTRNLVITFIGVFYIITLLVVGVVSVLSHTDIDVVVRSYSILLGAGVPALVGLAFAVQAADRAETASTVAATTQDIAAQTKSLVNGHTQQLLDQNARLTSLTETVINKTSGGAA